MSLDEILLEAEVLTPVSQKLIKNNDIVTKLASAVRTDAQFNSSQFPPGSVKNFKNARDDEVAQWFLENLDRIEREGYEGVVYSRNGANNEWVVRQYIAGQHEWEDIIGKLNMALSDWYLLQRAGVLDQNHANISRFKGIHGLTSYIKTHYGDVLPELKKEAQEKALAKNAKSIKLVDNEDYRIYTVLNRAAGVRIGVNSSWCTANTKSSFNFFNYANQGMLFQLIPYAKDKEGKKIVNDREKCQFDAATYSFKDSADVQLSADRVSSMFPYLYNDLVTALSAQKGKIQSAIKELGEDPALSANPDTKILQYNIDEEIQKLQNFVNKRYFIDKTRPAPITNQADQINTQQEGQPAMENKRTLKQMLESLAEDISLGRIVQEYRPVSDSGDQSTLTYGNELEEDNFEGQPQQQDMGTLPTSSVPPTQTTTVATDTSASTTPPQVAAPADQDTMNHVQTGEGDETSEMIGKISYMQDLNLSKAGEFYDPVSLQDKNISKEELTQIYNQVMGNVNEDDMGQDQEMPAQTGGSLGSMGGASGAAGGPYPPGTAPTMPESIKKGNIAMETVDKDVAAMLGNLKKYDKLVESCAPVLGMKTLTNRLSEEGQPWEANTAETETVDEAEGYDGPVTHGKYNEPRKSEKTDYGSKHIGSATGKGAKGQQRGMAANVSTKDKTVPPVVGSGKKQVTESEVDQDVLSWMNRFAKLGNMKGYCDDTPFQKDIKEATGDEQFDRMLGKISGNKEPQPFSSNRTDNVINKAENPSSETITALNNMMHDMHITMMTADRLMKKLANK